MIRYKCFDIINKNYKKLKIDFFSLYFYLFQNIIHNDDKLSNNLFSYRYEDTSIFSKLYLGMILKYPIATFFSFLTFLKKMYRYIPNKQIILKPTVPNINISALYFYLNCYLIFSKISDNEVSWFMIF